MLSESDLSALIITLKLAGITTILLLLVGTPIAWWLARTQWRFKFLLEAIIALPLVLPPTVLGFYLLVAISLLSLLAFFAKQKAMRETK